MVDSLSPAAQVLQCGDVLMAVDSVPIGDDGTVAFRDDERVDFIHLVNPTPAHSLAFH